MALTLSQIKDTKNCVEVPLTIEEKEYKLKAIVKAIKENIETMDRILSYEPPPAKLPLIPESWVLYYEMPDTFTDEMREILHGEERNCFPVPKGSVTRIIEGNPNLSWRHIFESCDLIKLGVDNIYSPVDVFERLAK